MYKPQMKHMAAMALIGDGLVGLFAPRRHLRRWKIGPRPYRKMMRAFSRRPTLTRILSGVGVGIGLWMVLRRN